MLYLCEVQWYLRDVPFLKKWKYHLKFNNRKTWKYHTLKNIPKAEWLWSLIMRKSKRKKKNTWVLDLSTFFCLYHLVSLIVIPHFQTWMMFLMVTVGKQTSHSNQMTLYSFKKYNLRKNVRAFVSNRLMTHFIGIK